MRPEATGYGAVFFLNHMIEAQGDQLKGAMLAHYLTITRGCVVAEAA